jgi:hypothetical protein
MAFGIAAAPVEQAIRDEKKKGQNEFEKVVEMTYGESSYIHSGLEHPATSQPLPLPTLLPSRNSEKPGSCLVPQSPKRHVRIDAPPGLSLQLPEPSASTEMETTLQESSLCAPSLEAAGYVPGRLLRCHIARSGDAKQSRRGDAKQSTQVLKLSNAISDEPEPTLCGWAGCPSRGSVHHHMGMCMPCDFVNRGDSCRAGADCNFCHLCGPEENKQRRKSRQKQLKMAKKWNQEAQKWNEALYAMYESNAALYQASVCHRQR